MSAAALLPVDGLPGGATLHDLTREVTDWPVAQERLVSLLREALRDSHLCDEHAAAFALADAAAKLTKLADVYRRKCAERRGQGAG